MLFSVNFLVKNVVQGFGTEKEMIKSYEKSSIRVSNINTLTVNPVLAGLVFDSVIDSPDDFQSTTLLEKIKV